MAAWQDRQYQTDYLDEISANWRNGLRRQLMVAPTGSGKCLGIDTPVMMFDGSVKMVQDVAVGDDLMGPDSQRRRVLSLARGCEAMYRVVPVKGDSYVVNESHILSIKLTPDAPGKPSRVVNISVSDYLKQNTTFLHRAKGYRVGVEFAHRDVPVDPYYIGLWLADGISQGLSVTKPDPEVQEFMSVMAARYGLHSKNAYAGIDHCPMWTITHGVPKLANPLLDAMRRLNLIGNKHVPDLYKVNSREVRLQLLAGLLDGDGSLSSGGYDFCGTRKQISESVVFLARSLGLAAYMRERTTRTQHGTPCVSWRVSISGECSVIPCRIARKKCPPRRQVKDVLVTGIKVIPIGPGDYYGFELDGDGLFLLGDFTVTHNTRVVGMMAERMVSRTKASGKTCRMLVMAERRKLVEQLASQMQRCGIRWHVEMANLPDGETIGNEWARRDEQAPVWVGSRDTLLSRSVRNEWLTLPKFDLLIVDEAHLFDRGHSRRMMEVVNAPFVLGATATPCYGDGTGLGRENWDVIVEKVTTKQLVQQGYLTPVRYFAPPELGKKRKAGDKTGVSGDPVKHWMDYAEGKRTVAFLPGVKEAYAVRDRFRQAGVTAEVIEADTPHKDRQRIMADIAAGKVLWCGGVGTLTTGVDVPEWEVCQLLIKCGSFSKFRQCGGRIMRPCPDIGKKYGIFLDHSAAVLEHGFLDEDVPWELEESGDVADRVKKEREAGERANPVCCAKCGCLFAGSPVCPECGAPIPRRERTAEPDIHRELLVEINANQETAGQFALRKQREWTVFLRMCSAKGWPAKRANVMFKSKFGDWPENMGVTPTFSRSDRDTPVSELCPNLVRKKATN